MTRSYTHPSPNGALIGAIFGTGTNGCYLDRMEHIPKLSSHKLPSNPEFMIVNMEWAAFDNKMNVMPRTDIDDEIDKQSINPGYQMFEKRISGMFLGEIFRLAVLKLQTACKASLFESHTGSKLTQQWAIDSALLSLLASTSDASQKKDHLSQHLDIPSSRISDQVTGGLSKIASAIATRSARLAAVAVSAVCEHSGRFDNTTETLDIGADGSLVEHYPSYVTMLKEACTELLGEEKANRIEFGLAKGKWHHCPPPPPLVNTRS